MRKCKIVRTNRSLALQAAASWGSRPNAVFSDRSRAEQRLCGSSRELIHIKKTQIGTKAEFRDMLYQVGDICVQGLYALPVELCIRLSARFILLSDVCALHLGFTNITKLHNDNVGRSSTSQSRWWRRTWSGLTVHAEKDTILGWQPKTMCLLRHDLRNEHRRFDRYHARSTGDVRRSVH